MHVFVAFVEESGEDMAVFTLAEWASWRVVAQKSVNMLTSLKLNAVQVIKFMGEYNYRSMRGYLNKSYAKLGHRNDNYLSKDHAKSCFSTKSCKISVKSW